MEIQHMGLVLSGLLCRPTSSILSPCEAKLNHMPVRHELLHQSQLHPLNIEDSRFSIIALTRLGSLLTPLLRYDQKVAHQLGISRFPGLHECKNNQVTLHSLRLSGRM